MFETQNFQRNVETARQVAKSSDLVLAAKRERGLQLIVEARQDQDQAEVARILHGLCRHFVVRPLFPREAATDASAPHEPDWTDKIFAATIGDVAFDDVAASPWDIAHAVRLEGRFRKVTPEVPVVRPVAPEPDAKSTPTYVPGWEHELMRIPQAWAEIRRQGREPGTNVRIGHPDYGWLEHEIWDKGNLDVRNAHNTMVHEARANPKGMDLLIGPQAGHGLATASVMVAPLTEPRRPMTGVAPASVVVPIRCVTNVILHPTQGEVAAAIRYAVKSGCRVISLSLGGEFLWVSNLGDAIREAIAQNVILVAASGNYLWFNAHTTVEPARWREMIAVAGIEKTDKGYRPWGHSARNPIATITISAPAYPVLRAVNRPTRYETSEGTSYATAFVAGVAALWLSRWFPNGYPRGKLVAQENFRRCLLATRLLTAEPPNEHDEWFSGLINPERLMTFEPYPVGSAAEAASVPEPTQTDDFADLVGLADTASAGVLLAASFLEPAARDDAEALDPWVTEVVSLLRSTPGMREALSAHAAAATLDPGVLRAAVRPLASDPLRRQIAAAEAAR